MCFCLFVYLFVGFSYSTYLLDQWFSSFTLHKNNLSSCLKCKFLGHSECLIQEVAGRDKESTLLSNSSGDYDADGSQIILRNSVFDIALPPASVPVFSFYSLLIPAQSHPFWGLKLPYICWEYPHFFLQLRFFSPEL